VRRVDNETMFYSLPFSSELEAGWDWTERYPSQQELHALCPHVADVSISWARYASLRRRSKVRWSEDAQCLSIGTKDEDNDAPRAIA